MVTWLYDETGQAGAVLDEFCVRSIDGAPQAWVFGVSVFALKGEHIGWFEHGVLFDVDNRKLGFLSGALGLCGTIPPLADAPPLPVFSKRPNVPTLRARLARPAAAGWSEQRLADYLEEAIETPALRRGRPDGSQQEASRGTQH